MSVPARSRAGRGNPPQRTPERRLVILARWPAPGRCKRRLAKELGDRRAARVQARLNDHVLAASRGACAAAAAELVLATSGIGLVAARRWGLSLGADRVVPQGPGSLGLRLRRQVVRARRQGVRHLLLIGSDLPELAAADLIEAFQALALGSPLVLGPALDGGYWLIGLGWQGPAGCSAFHRAVGAPRLFAGAEGPIPWGSDAVLRQTLAAADREGLAETLLSVRSDLDRAADLARWR
jgi:rSAM/selenodomain-associated transferase 1